MRYFVFLAIFPAIAFSQESQPGSKGFHRHDGFYLSMSTGPAFGGIELQAKTTNQNGTVTFSGAGAIVDIKVGGAITENFIVSFDVIGRSIVSPEIAINGTTFSTTDEVSASDNSYNLGVTYYFMPANIFVNGSVGIAAINLTNGNNKYSSEVGVALHIKVGKEWWVSKNWGLGISGGYGFVGAKDKRNPSEPSYSGTLSSNKLFVMFNTTYN